MIGALLLGLFCGVVARILVPGDVFRKMSGPKSWLVSIGLGLLGALVGYLIFTVGLGIGDTDIFDWGGVLSALIGTIIVVIIASWVLRRTARRSGQHTTWAIRLIDPGLRLGQLTVPEDRVGAGLLEAAYLFAWWAQLGSNQ